MADSRESSSTGRKPETVPNRKDGDTETPLDPRILALAGIIGRLIARERFKELLAAESQSNQRRKSEM
jgi:hypothetical protein